MQRWLVKEEPTHYAFDDLVRDGRASWTGVHHPLAQRYLRAMRPGDDVFYYHSGVQRSVVGVARVATEPRIDLKDPRGAFTVDITPVRALPRAVALKEIREDPMLARMPLVRIPRLSVQPVTAEEWKRIEARAMSPAAERRLLRTRGI